MTIGVGQRVPPPKGKIIFSGSSISSRHVEYAGEYFTGGATSANMGRELLMFVVHIVPKFVSRV